MKVKEAQNRLEYLKRLANNVRLVNQYFLNIPDDELEEIADKHGIDSTIKKVMEDAVYELYTLTSKYESAIQEAEIADIIIR